MPAPETQLIKKLEQCYDLMYELDSPQVYMKMIHELIEWAADTYGLIDDDE